MVQYALLTNYITMEQWLKGVCYIFLIALVIVFLSKRWMDNSQTDRMQIAAGLVCSIVMAVTGGIIIPFITSKFFLHCY